MPVVHVFASANRFASDEALDAFVDPTYSDDGDMLPSTFMREVGLSSYEPMCIERVRAPSPQRAAELLRAASYADQWLRAVDRTIAADVVISVYAPNVVSHPNASSLDYIGAFTYEPR